MSGVTPSIFSRSSWSACSDWFSAREVSRRRSLLMALMGKPPRPKPIRGARASLPTVPTAIPSGMAMTRRKVAHNRSLLSRVRSL